MKTAISIPDGLYNAAERVAKHLGISRSELYRKALAKYLESRNDAAITDELNRIHDSEYECQLDPILDSMQRASLVREDW